MYCWFPCFSGWYLASSVFIFSPGSFSNVWTQTTSHCQPLLSPTRQNALSIQINIAGKIPKWHSIMSSQGFSHWCKWWVYFQSNRTSNLEGVNTLCMGLSAGFTFWWLKPRGCDVLSTVKEKVAKKKLNAGYLKKPTPGHANEKGIQISTRSISATYVWSSPRH